MEIEYHNPFQDWGAKNLSSLSPLPISTSFSFVISTYIEISSKNFVTFSFHPFASHHYIYNIIWAKRWHFVGDVMGNNDDVLIFISKYLYFKKAYSSQFCWHHQNCNHVYWNTFKDLKNVKRIRIRVKIWSIPVFFHIRKTSDFRWKNTDVSKTLEVCN